MAKRGRRRGRGGVALRRYSTEAIRAELGRRQGHVGRLGRLRDKLASRLANVESEIAALGGEIVAAARGLGRRGRVRPKNDMNLVDALAKVLKGRTMSVTEASAAVQKAGYRTSSANFRTIVNQTLIKSDKFRKVSRGKYTAS